METVPQNGQLMFKPKVEQLITVNGEKQGGTYSVGHREGSTSADDSADIQPRVPDFDRVRQVCERDLYDKFPIDLRPQAFAQYKRAFWPSPVPGVLPDNIARIYDVVRQTGLPNALGARLPVPTALNLEAWNRNLDQVGGRPQLLDFLRFGFPLGYVGPVTNTHGVQNHPSAVEYPTQVRKFINKELGNGGLCGPYATPPPPLNHGCTHPPSCPDPKLTLMIAESSRT